MQLLFLSFLMTPTDTDYKTAYAKSKLTPDIPDELLKKLHYTDGEIAAIKKELTGA